MRDVNMFRRSMFAGAEIMDVFERTATERELVLQSKELCRDFIHSRIIREGLSLSKVEPDLPEPHGALVDVSMVLLKLGITWGKVVAIYAVAAGLAVDCVRQGHPVMVHTIVDSLGEFVRRSLVPWLRKRGGWGDISKCVVNMDSSARTHWLLAAVLTWRQFLKTMYIYLTK